MCSYKFRQSGFKGGLKQLGPVNSHFNLEYEFDIENITKTNIHSYSIDKQLIKDGNIDMGCLEITK